MSNVMKKALVTGASRGIGSGIALCLAAEGYDLAISYATERQGADALAARIMSGYGRKCSVFQANLLEEGSSEALVEQAIQALGGLDLLVSNAGVVLMDSIQSMPLEHIDTLIRLDFRNYLLLAQAAARYMIDNQVAGNIISITSSRAERAYPGDAVYGGIKAAIERATESMALDLAPYGIRVNCVAPGAIRIRTNEELAAQKFGPADMWDKLGERIPLGRSGLPEDIGNAVVFLASPRASYITGVTLRVDGGLILPGMPEVIDPDNTRVAWGYTGKP
ncbi:MAG: SDR family oxidoreductase [Chloroflexi bacterium]|nr:SDR family oxidoreductase [Chloroflexota bacterium]